MSEKQKKILEQQLWIIANMLRGIMNTNEYRDYILGFIFTNIWPKKWRLYSKKLIRFLCHAYRH